MKKRVKKTKLSRKKGARRALVKNLVKALIFSGKITTTKTKAKFAQKYAEKLISLAKKNTLAGNRRIFAQIGDKKATKKLITDIVPKFATVNSGFTRVINLGTRLGDAAPIALLEFTYGGVDAKEAKVENKKEPQVEKKPEETKATKVKKEK